VHMEPGVDGRRWRRPAATGLSRVECCGPISYVAVAAAMAAPCAAGFLFAVPPLLPLSLTTRRTSPPPSVPHGIFWRLGDGVEVRARGARLPLPSAPAEPHLLSRVDQIGPPFVAAAVATSAASKFPSVAANQARHQAGSPRRTARAGRRRRSQKPPRRPLRPPATCGVIHRTLDSNRGCHVSVVAPGSAPCRRHRRACVGGNASNDGASLSVGGAQDCRRGRGKSGRRRRQRQRGVPTARWRSRHKATAVATRDRASAIWRLLRMYVATRAACHGRHRVHASVFGAPEQLGGVGR